MKPVSLQEVAEHLLMMCDGLAVYISTKTGEIMEVSEDLEMMAGNKDEWQPDWAKELIPEIRRVLESDDFIQLPDQYEIDDYSIMRDFCERWPEEALQNKLLRTIRGSGAFRRFKNLVMNRGIEQDWYQFQGSALKIVARRFLEQEGIPYIDETPAEK